MRLSVVSELLRYSLFTSCATPCLLTTAPAKHLCAIGFFCSCSISHEKQGRKLYGFRPVKAELEAEGYIASVQGKGSYVCAKDETVRMRINELKAELGQLAAELRGLGVPGEELAELVKGGRDE